MRRLIFTAIIVGAAAAASGCNGRESEDAGAMTAKNFAVGDFKRIESAGAFDVTVRTGAPASVRAEGPQKVLDRLIVEVKGDELSIRPRNGSFSWGKSGPVRIAVTVPELQGATIAGSGTLSVDKVVTDKFKATIAGSGDISLPSIAAKSVEVEIAGSGSGSLAGQTDQAAYVIAGSGELDAAKLKSKDLKLTIAGSGSIDANASGNATGEILGSGEARISGGAKCTIEKAGSGSIVCS
jgi:hypothetical protein